MTLDDADPTRAQDLYAWLVDLCAFRRSLTGDGVRQTFAYLKNILPDLQVHEVPSGTKAFDWTVPDEWNIRAAYIEDQEGKRVLDFEDCPLHVVGYSEPVDTVLPLEKLKERIYTHSKLPHAIPYVTSYYQRHWGFCMSQDMLAALPDGDYHAVIDSTLAPGHLTYADLVLPGQREEEVLISTYTCHPPMANDNTSGIVVALALANWLQGLAERKYTYRFVFVPETIGSIVYLSRHLEHLKNKTIAGYVLTCLSDDRAYSFLPTPNGSTLPDRIARHVLANEVGDFIEYSFLQRGSDERQYCAPGVDLPVASIMRSKYNEYPEYHTSLDNLDLASPEGLMGGYRVVRSCLHVLEHNAIYRNTVLCEPQLGRRGLYPNLSTPDNHSLIEDMMNVWVYCDGRRDLLTIAETIRVPFARVLEIANRFVEAGVFAPVDAPLDGAGAG